MPYVSERAIPGRHEVLDAGTMWKNGLTDEQVLERVLRSYLIRCHRTVSNEYPEIRNMEPEQAADFLLHLRRTGRIKIQLYRKTQDLIGCRITELGAGAEPVADGQVGPPHKSPPP